MRNPYSPERMRIRSWGAVDPLCLQGPGVESLVHVPGESPKRLLCRERSGRRAGFPPGLLLDDGRIEALIALEVQLRQPPAQAHQAGELDRGFLLQQAGQLRGLLRQEARDPGLCGRSRGFEIEGLGRGQQDQLRFLSLAAGFRGGHFSLRGMVFGLPACVPRSSAMGIFRACRDWPENVRRSRSVTGSTGRAPAPYLPWASAFGEFQPILSGSQTLTALRETVPRPGFGEHESIAVPRSGIPRRQSARGSGLCSLQTREPRLADLLTRVGPR